MERTHPEVSSEIDYIAWPDGELSLPTAESMPVALEYIAEYAATFLD
ncbi:MAG: hypothetical protein WBM90_10650 [Acidimicrobiia bacterium]